MMVRWNSRSETRKPSASLTSFRCTSTIARKPVDIGVGQALGRHPRDAAVDQHAGLVERVDVLRVERDEELQRAEQIGGVERGDVGAAALAGLDHAEDLQAPHRLAQARAAHLQHLREVALRRKLVARLEVAGPDQVEDLLRHLVGDRVALDRRDDRQRRRPCQSPSARVRIWSRLTASISTTPARHVLPEARHVEQGQPVVERAEDEHGEQRPPDAAAPAVEAGAAEDDGGDDGEEMRRRRRSGAAAPSMAASMMPATAPLTPETM